MKNKFRLISLGVILFGVSSFLPNCLHAQDAQATIKLKFTATGDSIKVCKAIVTAADKPVKEISVKFYAKRFFSLLPIGKAVVTNDEGEATVTFPNDLPGNATGNITVIAKIEEDDTYGTVEAQDSIKWGLIKAADSEDVWAERSLSASRDKAPTYLIIASNAIIVGVWLTLAYVMFSLYKIKKASGKPGNGEKIPKV